MILIISRNNRIAKDITEIFHYMGVLSYGTTPNEALSEISTLYKAILILEPSLFPDINDYVKRIRAYNTYIPIYAISADEYTPKVNLLDYVYSKTVFSTSVAVDLIERLNSSSNAKIGMYKLAGFDASYNSIGVTYFFDSFNITKTEMMILRYLIRCYPLPQNAKQILKYSFKHSRVPEEHSIKTHISSMNKKFTDLTGRKMIELIPSKGYIIITPEPKYNL